MYTYFITVNLNKKELGVTIEMNIKLGEGQVEPLVAYALKQQYPEIKDITGYKIVKFEVKHINA